MFLELEVDAVLAFRSSLNIVAEYEAGKFGRVEGEDLIEHVEIARLFNLSKVAVRLTERGAHVASERSATHQETSSRRSGLAP